MVKKALSLSTESQKLVLWARRIVNKLMADLAKQDKKYAEDGDPEPTTEEMRAFRDHQEMTNKARHQGLVQRQKKRKPQPADGFDPRKRVAGVPSATVGVANTDGQTGELRDVDAVFATHGSVVENRNGNPSGHIYPPGATVPSTMNSQAAGGDFQKSASAAAFAAARQAQRQFSTFNNAPPPGGK